MTYLAIDIGGTKTLIASFSTSGEIQKSHKFPTPQDSTAFSTTLLSALQNFPPNPQKIIIAVPGIVQPDSSVTPANLQWHNFSPAHLLSTHFSCPILTKNDADLATLAESASLKGKTIYLTFSTGIGGGIAKNGLLTSTSATFEPGHIQYPWQGQSLQWEHFASTRAIKSAHHIDHITTATLNKKVIQDISTRLTPGIADILLTHRPDFLIIGGPLALIFDQFASHLHLSLQTNLPSSSPQNLLKTPTLLIDTNKKFIHPQTNTIIIQPALHPTESVIRGCFRLAHFPASASVVDSPAPTPLTALQPPNSSKS